MDEFAEINEFKKEIEDSITSLLDDLRNEKIHSIRSSFTIATNREIEAIKSVLKEISDSNTDICGRVDVLDPLEKDVVDKAHEIPVVKGVVWILFLRKDKDKYDHPDINRFHSEYTEPGFYTDSFDEEYNSLLENISAVKEKLMPFSYLKLKLSIDNSELVSGIVNEIEKEGLKCKVIKKNVSNLEYAYFFMYGIECEEMNKMMQDLEK